MKRFFKRSNKSGEVVLIKFKTRSEKVFKFKKKKRRISLLFVSICFIQTKNCKANSDFSYEVG